MLDDARPRANYVSGKWGRSGSAIPRARPRRFSCCAINLRGRSRVWVSQACGSMFLILPSAGVSRWWPKSCHQRPSRTQNAGFLTFEAKVTVSLSSAGSPNRVVTGRHEHDGVDYFLIRQMHGGSLPIPEWMFNPAACSIEIEAEPRLSVTKLLYLCFRNIRNRALATYRSMHLAHGRRLFEQSRLSIGESSFATGFSSTGHFSKAFKGWFGAEPITFDVIFSRRWSVCP